VRAAERDEADELFGADAEHMTELARGIAGKKSAAAVGGAAGRAEDGGERTGKVKLNAKERKRVEAMIRNAKSLAEIERLEREVNEGRIPGGVVADDDDDDDDDEDMDE
jgi:U2 small nuclear ribonucleoprotein A'